MRGKDFSTGLRGGLFEKQHYARMGKAIWLYGWLVLRQTNQCDGVGLVLGGTPITYREIQEETGFNCRTLERWMRDLRRAGYIETAVVPAGIVVRITKAKKFPQSAQGARRTEGGIRKLAEGGARSCVVRGSERLSHHEVTDGMDSSFIEGSIEKQTKSEIHRDFHSLKENSNYESTANAKRSRSESRNPNQNPIQHPESSENPSCLDRNRNTQPNPWQRPPYRQLFIEAMRKRELMRAERDEEVRRELAVGTGPELQRS